MNVYASARYTARRIEQYKDTPLLKYKRYNECEQQPTVIFGFTVSTFSEHDSKPQTNTFTHTQTETHTVFLVIGDTT